MGAVQCPDPPADSIGMDLRHTLLQLGFGRLRGRKVKHHIDWTMPLHTIHSLSKIPAIGITVPCNLMLLLKPLGDRVAFSTQRAA